jgi:putative membrane protein
MGGFWIWQLSVTAVLVSASALYLRGWLKLQRYQLARQSPTARRAAHRALALFLAGLALLSIALLSPLHPLAELYFTARTAQHLLLIGAAPSLLLSANPLPVLVQGLPARWLGWLARRSRPVPAVAQTGRALTSAGAVWVLFAATFWLWYDPALHQATREHGWLRAVEVGSLLGTAVLYWWRITGALPRTHRPLPTVLRIGYTFAGVVAIKAVGVIFMFMPDALYAYAAVFQFGNLAVSDQLLGGVIFWALGGSVYALMALLLLRQWLGQEENKPGLPENAWATDEAMLAPGLKK